MLRSLTIKCTKQVKHNQFVTATQITDSGASTLWDSVFCNSSLKATAGCQSNTKVTLTHDRSEPPTLTATTERHSVIIHFVLFTHPMSSVFKIQCVAASFFLCTSKVCEDFTVSRDCSYSNTNRQSDQTG